MKNLTGFILGFLATAAWGSFYIAGRWLFGEEGEINSWLFNFLRFGLATAALTPLLFFSGNRQLVKKALYSDWKSFLLISLVGIVMESILIFCSLNYTTAARSSLMANCSPIATVILSYLLLKQRTPGLGILGMIIGFGGIVLAGFAPGGDIYADTGLSSLIGDAMALGSGFCWAFFTVYGAAVSQKYGGPVCMFISFLFGTILMIPALFFTVSLADWQAFRPQLWAGTIYTGVVTLAWANACWYTALRYLKPNVLGAFGYLSAAITFTLSLMVLKEKFSILFIVSIILILFGMTLLMSNPSKSECSSGGPEQK